VVSEGWCACLKVETVEGTLLVVADDSPTHHLLPLPHCGYDKSVLVFLPDSACDPMTSWILSNRQWYLVRAKNRSPVSLHVILDPLEPFDACTIGNGRRVSHYTRCSPSSAAIIRIVLREHHSWLARDSNVVRRFVSIVARIPLRRLAHA